MFWKNWSWSARILSVVALGMLAAILFSVFARSSREPYSRRSCISNLKQIGLGMLQYSQDYDEHLPPVRCQGSVYGWADAFQPYIKSLQIYQCPQQRNNGQPNPRESGYTDYAFNARMGKKWLGSLSDPNNRILMLDGNATGDVTNARYAFSQIPRAWFTDNASPLYRHLETANYLFADGHVKWYKPSQIGGTGQPQF